ncbi:DUF2255 family protein [Oryzihumus sp.]
MWTVGDAPRVCVRSTNGRSAAWFRGATPTGEGQVVAGTAYDVTFTEAAAAELAWVDAAYRRKYGHYPSIVDHLIEDGPRSATPQAHPGLTPPTSEPTHSWSASAPTTRSSRRCARPPRRHRRLRRRTARHGPAAGGHVLEERRAARRPRARPRVPARAAPARVGPPDEPGRVFDLTLTLEQLAEGMPRWTSAGRSRRCCAPDRLGARARVEASVLAPTGPRQGQERRTG